MLDDTDPLHICRASVGRPTVSGMGQGHVSGRGVRTTPAVQRCACAETDCDRARRLSNWQMSNYDGCVAGTGLLLPISRSPSRQKLGRLLEHVTSPAKVRSL